MPAVEAEQIQNVYLSVLINMEFTSQGEYGTVRLIFAFEEES